MSHRNQPNIRTKFKHLLKNLSRGEINENDLELQLRDFGIFGNSSAVRQILKTNIKARIIHRIGQAAKKKGMLAVLYNFCPIFSQFDKTEFHKLNFIKITTKEIKETWEYVEIPGFWNRPHKLIKQEIIDHA